MPPVFSYQKGFRGIKGNLFIFGSNPQMNTYRRIRFPIAGKDKANYPGRPRDKWQEWAH